MEYTEAYLESIDEALADREFMETLTSIQSKEQLQELFLKSKNIKIDDAVAQAAFDKYTKISSGEELSAEDLELVAGGCRNCQYYVATGMMVGALAGCAGGPVGAAVGAIIGGTLGLIAGRKRFH